MAVATEIRESETIDVEKEAAKALTVTMSTGEERPFKNLDELMDWAAKQQERDVRQ